MKTKIMRLGILLGGALAALSACTNTVQPWSVKMTESEIRRNPEGRMLDFAKGLKWSYCVGLECQAFLQVADKYHITRYYDYVRQFADTIVGDDGTIYSYDWQSYNIDMLNSGKMLLDLYHRNHEEKYKQAIFLLRQQLDAHPRTGEGGFWHKLRYPHQMWLDGLYMGAPFYAEFSKTFDRPQDFDDVVLQFQLVARHTYDPQTGLFRHGWDEARQQIWADAVTGQSPNVWGRAMGWFAMSLVDVLDFIPEQHHGRDTILQILQTVANGIEKYQDKESNLWFQVMDKGGQEGNYLESSCSAMFVYALQKAAQKNYIDSRFKQIAKNGYDGIIKTFVRENPDGTYSITNCCEVAGLGGDGNRDGSYEYYLSEPVRDNDPKAVGPFIMASLMFEN